MGLSGAQLAERLEQGSILVIPLGATEAHGPHLPLTTDTFIAEHLARVAAEQMESKTGQHVIIAPTFARTACSCAAGMPGTVTVPRDEERAALTRTLATVMRAGARRIAVVNLHFDPEHVAAIQETLAAIPAEKASAVCHVDLTRRANAQRIGGEFATGSCHGGEFETSLVLVAAPGHVDARYKDLPDNFVDLPAAIKAGKRTFAEMGMPQAYCGYPSRASAAEGERLYRVMAEIVVEGWRAAWKL